MAKGKSTCEMLPVSLPYLWHSNFASLLSPSGTSSSWPAEDRGMSSLLRGAGQGEATCSCAAHSQDGHVAGGKVLLGVAAMAQQSLLLHSAPAPTSDSRSLTGTAELFVSWGLEHLGKDPLQD